MFFFFLGGGRKQEGANCEFLWGRFTFVGLYTGLHMLFSGAVLFGPSRTFIFCQLNEHVRFHVVQPKNRDDHSLEQG